MYMALNQKENSLRTIGISLENKEVYGERLEDGTFSGRTLTEAIIAQREEKEAKYKDIGKQMKQGELAFTLFAEIA